GRGDRSRGAEGQAGPVRSRPGRHRYRPAGTRLRRGVGRSRAPDGRARAQEPATRLTDHRASGRTAARSKPGERSEEIGMRSGQGWRQLMACVAVIALLTSCASVPPTPVTSIEPLVGKWSGTVDTGRGPLQFFYLTINPDQTLVASWGLNWAWGQVTVADGQASYQMNPPPLEGTIRFYQGNGEPTLYLDDLFAEFYAVVTRRR